MYWVAVTIIVATVLINEPSGKHQPISRILAEVSDWLFRYGTPDINGFTGTSRIVAKVTWTLRYEWIFYLSLPLLAFVLRISNRAPLTLWLFAVLVLTLALWDLQIPYLQAETSFGFYFLVGALAASANRKDALRRIAQSRWITWAVFGAAALVLTAFDGAYGFRCALVLALVFTPIALGNTLFGLLTQRPLLLPGEISYSIYLMHGAILFFAFDYLFPGFLSSTTSSLALAAGLTAVAVGTVLISWITYTVIEKPCIDWGHRIGGRRSVHG